MKKVFGGKCCGNGINGVESTVENKSKRRVFFNGREIGVIELGSPPAKNVRDTLSGQPQEIEVKPIRFTKRLEEVFARYSVVWPNDGETIAGNIHLRCRYKLPPFAFAVWVAHCRANYRISTLVGRHVEHHQGIAEASNIELFEVDVDGDQALKDFHHLSKCLTDAGLYFALLD